MPVAQALLNPNPKPINFQQIFNMMIINFAYQPETVTAFFKANGFEIHELKFGYFNRKNQWIDSYEPAVIYNGKIIEVELLFSKLVERFSNTMLMQKDRMTKAAILSEIDKITTES